MQVEVKFPTIEAIKISPQFDEDGMKAIIQMKVPIHPSDISRLLFLQARVCPMYCHIGSNQAEFDLLIQSVDKHGEIKPLVEIVPKQIEGGEEQ